MLTCHLFMGGGVGGVPPAAHTGARAAQGGQGGGAYLGGAPWVPWCHTTPPKKWGGQWGAPCATLHTQSTFGVLPTAHHPHPMLPGPAQHTPQGAGWGACGTTAPPPGVWVLGVHGGPPARPHTHCSAPLDKLFGIPNCYSTRVNWFQLIKCMDWAIG